MEIGQELTRYKQIASMLAICGYHHVIKLAGNLIDAEEGVIEQRVSQLLARAILDNLQLQVTVEGVEHARDLEHYCVVSSHASHLDWAVLLAHFPSPLRFVAKRELLPVPVIGDYLRKRAILIDRSKGEDSRAAIARAARDGSPWPILIFPEGTRSEDGALRPFRPGGLRILAEAGLAMVPVCIRGTYDAFPRHARSIRTGLPLRMRIQPPITPGEALRTEDAMAEVERSIRQAAAELDREMAQSRR